jgi:hypothetical protein
LVRKSNARFAALAFSSVGWWRSHSKLSQYRTSSTFCPRFFRSASAWGHPKLATGFEPRIVQQKRKFRRFEWTTRPSPERVEHGFLAVTLVPTIKKPFDVPAEGLISKSSRDDKTPLEFF